MARLVIAAVMLLIVAPVVFGGVGLVVMLAGKVVGLDLSDGVIIAVSALPTAYICWRLYQHATAPDDDRLYS